MQELICDKDDDLKKVKREWKDKDDSMNDDIKMLKNTINKMKNELENECKMY